LKKAIVVGHLGEFFELTKVQPGPTQPAPRGMPREGTLILTLRAKKAVDTSELCFKVGCFDKEDILIRAVPLQLDGFPLEKGESIRVVCDRLLFADPVGKFVIRKSAKAGAKETDRPPDKARRDH
jgi:hypothetical protein